MVILYLIKATLSIDATPSIFENCESLINVNLNKPNTIIGEKAFKNCLEIIYIELNNVISIGEEAFYNTGIIQAHIDYVSSLPRSCFENCLNLESVTLSNNIINIGNSCFNNCINLGNIELPTFLSNLGVKYLLIIPLCLTFKIF